MVYLLCDGVLVFLLCLGFRCSGLAVFFSDTVGTFEVLFSIGF